MIEIIDCEQGSPEWFSARAGIPTASEFDTVLAQGRNGGPSKTRRDYMYKLLGERLTGEPEPDRYTNAHMERGKVMEAEARNHYSLLQDVDPTLVGFVRNGRVGASPDSLICTNGLLEIKTKLPRLLLDVLMSDEVPSEHVAQIQGQIWVCEREWCDFVAYWPKLKPFIKRVYRDEKYIAALAAAVARFNDESDRLQEQYEKIAA